MISRIPPAVESVAPMTEDRSEFPQSGWHPADRLCAALGMEHRCFMGNLKKLGIPFRKFGVVVLVDVETFLERLPVSGHAAASRPEPVSTTAAVAEPCQSESESELKMIRLTLDRLVEVVRSMGANPMCRATDADVLYYMTQLEKPLPPIRAIASAVGWSHSHILKNMPLSSAYFRHHNGRGVRPVRPTNDEGS